MVGIDIIEIERIVKANKEHALEKKILTQAEQDYLNSKSVNVVNRYCERDCTLAGYWTSKEAVLKALGLGIVDNLRKIEILHRPNGAPYVKLDAEFCEKYNINPNINIQISISHDAGVAICACIIM